METRKTDRETVVSQITNKNQYHYDIHRDPDELHAHLIGDNIEDPSVGYYYSSHAGHKSLSYSRWAITQLLNRFRVPLQFYDRCSPSLRRNIFNEHVTRTKNKRALLLRMDPHDEVEDKEAAADAECRAVLTTSYGIIDDHQLFPPVLDVLEGQDVETYNLFRYDDHLTQLVAEFPDCSVEYNGQRHTAGILVSNSETGHGAVWIEPAVLIGANGHRHFVNRSVLKSQGYNGRIVHRGDVNIERIQALTGQVKDIAQVGVVQMAEAWENRVQVSKALSYMKSIDALPERIYAILEEEWSEQQDLAKALVAQRIMEMAQTLPLFQRTPVEQAAGRFAGLFVGYRSRMQQIMEEIA